MEIPLSEAKHLIKLVSSDKFSNQKYEEHLRKEDDCFGTFDIKEDDCIKCRIAAQLGNRIEELWVFCKEYSAIEAEKLTNKLKSKRF